MNTDNSPNIDTLIAQGCGGEWHVIDQSELPEDEAQVYFDAYFALCRWDSVAHRNLAEINNITFQQAGVSAVPLPLASMDFGISLGVLHHVADTAGAIKSCAALLKLGAPLLLYLYYRFDDQPSWYRPIWKASELYRYVISCLPQSACIIVASLIAIPAYWPLTRLAKIFAELNINTKAIPLSYSHDASFYTMRTDILDCFGTELEPRFTRKEIVVIRTTTGCYEIRFSEKPPYWCVSTVRTQ